MKFRLVAPNVAFRGSYRTGTDWTDARSKHPAISRLESVGFHFEPDGTGWTKIYQMVEMEINTMEELVELVEKSGVFVQIQDRNTLYFDNP